MMKSTTCFIVLVTCFFFSNAQISKGRWMVGGSASFTSSNNNTSVPYFEQDLKQTSYNLSPGVGYFIIDQLCAGIRLNVSHAKTKDIREGTSPLYFFDYNAVTTVSGTGIGAFARYYLFKPKTKFNAFAEGSYSYNSEKTKSRATQTSIVSGSPPSYSETRTDTKYKVNYYSLAAGPVIFVSKNVSFELSAGYTIGKVTKQDQQVNRFTIGTGFQVYIGK